MPRAKPAGFVDPMPPVGFADLMPTVVATFDDGARSERGVLSGALALDRLAMGLAGAVTESPAQLRLGITSTAAAALAIGTPRFAPHRSAVPRCTWSHRRTRWREHHPRSRVTRSIGWAVHRSGSISRAGISDFSGTPARSSIVRLLSRRDS